MGCGIGLSARFWTDIIRDSKDRDSPRPERERSTMSE